MEGATMDHQTFAQLLGNYGEFVGALAVVATLVYLTLQVRYQANQIKIASFQASTARYDDLMAYALGDPENFSWFRDGLRSYTSLRPEDQARFHSHLIRVISSYRQNLVLLDAGAIPKSILIGQKRDIARILKCSGAAEWAESVSPEHPKAKAGWDALIRDILDGGESEKPQNIFLPFLAEQSD
jgi:hypothetical protein